MWRRFVTCLRMGVVTKWIIIHSINPFKHNNICVHSVQDTGSFIGIDSMSVPVATFPLASTLSHRTHTLSVKS